MGRHFHQLTYTARLKIEMRVNAGVRVRDIAADNGSEFMDLVGMERSCRRSGKRTTVYYCHPYTASERGTNENVNRMIRWHFPKGTSFETVTASLVRQAEDWINIYPRSILDFEDAETAFWAELEAA